VHASGLSFESENAGFDREEAALSELIANKYGKKIWKIKPSGFCMVEAWDFASKLALGKKYDGDFKSLLKKALAELRQKSAVFNLVGDYEEELLRYENLGDYTKGAIDYLPCALVNITGMKCIITQVNDEGKECSLTLYPSSHDIETNFVGPEIQVVFSRLRGHYDVAVNADFTLPEAKCSSYESESIF
jgi:hypothetical protein